MTEQLRRLLTDLADDAPTTVDRAAVQRVAVRRQAAAVGLAGALVLAAGAGGAVLLRPGTDTLSTAPVAVAPGPAVPLPDQLVAGDGSRVGTFRTEDLSRVEWLSPQEPGRGVGDLALAPTQVLYSLGDGGTRDVRAAVRPARPGSGPFRLGEPGDFSPAVLDDGLRYAHLATGDDAAYSPRSVGDLRLVLTASDTPEAVGSGVQAAVLDADVLLGGLAFAGPDRLVLSEARRQDAGRHGLLVVDFQTDEAPLGSRAPDTRFLEPPDGCSWTLPTETPAEDVVLVVQRCGGPSGGAWDAVTVDVRSGERVGVFGTVRRDGPGQVDSVDLDASGQHLVAQVNTGGGAVAGPVERPAPVVRTVDVGEGRTVTTVEGLVSPAWR